jgi:hypothetical protein
MQPLKAQVHNGRLILDEATDLPEGKVVELLPVEDVRFGDDLDAEERARLHEALRESYEQMQIAGSVAR